MGMVGMMVCLGVLGQGCANQPDQGTTPSPSVQDVRGNSDRFFQKMEQEESAQPTHQNRDRD